MQAVAEVTERRASTEVSADPRAYPAGMCFALFSLIFRVSRCDGVRCGLSNADADMGNTLRDRVKDLSMSEWDLCKLRGLINMFVVFLLTGNYQWDHCKLRGLLNTFIVVLSTGNYQRLKVKLYNRGWKYRTSQKSLTFCTPK